MYERIPVIVYHTWLTYLMDSPPAFLFSICFKEEPDYLLQPSATVHYTYDAVGNRLTQTDDYGTTTYKYDAANRLLSTSNETFKYDKNGNMVERNTENGLVEYTFTPENQLEQVSYPDDTYVKYQYDAFDRKVYREEQYYDLNGPGESMGHGKGYGRDNNPGQGNGYGKSNNPTPGSNGNGGVGNGKGKGNSGNNGNGHAYGRNNGISNYQLKKEDTRYLYDASNQLLNEYTGAGDPLAQYYYANGEVVARKMFGFKDRKDQGYLGNLRDRGHLLFYHYDQGGNVTDLTDHLRSEVVKYRYDAFGGQFTNAWSPYNYFGLTGKSYDLKASLMDYSARWYSPTIGRFTSADSWTGDTTLPQTLNRYAYTLNNPVKYSDPSGHMPCYEDANGNPRCGYSDNPDDWGVTVPNPPIVPAGPTEEQLRALKELDYNRLAGLNPANEDTSSPYDDYDYYDDAAGVKAANKFFFLDALNTLFKDKDATVGQKILAALSLIPFGGPENKAAGKATEVITSVLKRAKRVGDRLEATLDDGTKVIFRKDVGSDAHPIGKKYPDPVDHYNIEIHKPQGNGRYKQTNNFHIIVDEDGNVVEILE